MRKGRLHCKQGLILVEASISMIVLSLMLYTFYLFIDVKIDNWTEQENWQRMEDVQNEIIKYIAKNGIENAFKGNSIFPISSANNFNATPINYKNTDYITGELEKNIFKDLKIKNTDGKIFQIITSKAFNENIQYQNLQIDETSLDNVTDISKHNLDYATFSDQVSYGNFSNNSYNEKLKNNKNYIAFLLCEDGAIVKNKKTCQTVSIAAMLYKINNTKNAATPINQFIAIDDILDNSIVDISQKSMRDSKIFHVLIQKDKFAKVFYNTKTKAMQYIVYKKPKIGDLIWHKEKNSLYILEKNAAGEKQLQYINSIDNQRGNLNNVKWLTAGVTPTESGIYVQNGENKVFQIDERLQRFNIFEAQDKELIFDKNNGIFRYYNESNQTWIASYLHDEENVAMNEDCGGLPCAIPGIRKCGPPSPTNDNMDIYGRFIVNDIVKKYDNSPNDILDLDSKADGLYLVKEKYRYYYSLKINRVQNNISQNRNWLSKVDKGSASNFSYNSPAITINAIENIENAVTNFDIKTFEICVKGTGVFVYNKEIFHDPNNADEHPFLAIIDGNIDSVTGINVVEVDQEDTKTGFDIDDKKSILKKVNSNAENDDSLGCMQKHYKMIYYKDESIGHFNPIVALYSNKPFKVKVKGGGEIAVSANEIIAKNNPDNDGVKKVWQTIYNNNIPINYSYRSYSAFALTDNNKQSITKELSSKCKLKLPNNYHNTGKMKFWKTTKPSDRQSPIISSCLNKPGHNVDEIWKFNAIWINSNDLAATYHIMSKCYDGNNILLYNNVFNGHDLKQLLFIKVNQDITNLKNKDGDHGKRIHNNSDFYNPFPQQTTKFGPIYVID